MSQRTELLSVDERAELLAVVSGNRLKLWDTASQEVRHNFSHKKHNNARISCIQWLYAEKRNASPKKLKELRSSSSLAIGTESGVIILWDFKAGTTTEFGGKGEHASRVTGLSCHPSSTILYSCSSDASVLGWDTQSRSIVSNFSVSKPLGCISVNPSGETVAVGSSIVHILDIANGNSLLNFTGHFSPIVCLETSPNGQFVLSGAIDGDRFLNLWNVDLDSPRPQPVVFALEARPVQASFNTLVPTSADLSFLAVTEDGTLHVFSHAGSAAVKKGKSKPILPIFTVRSTTGATILHATFVKARSILVAFGSDVKPLFVKLVISDAASSANPEELLLSPDGTVAAAASGAATPMDVAPADGPKPAAPGGLLLGPTPAAPPKASQPQAAVIGFAAMNMAGTRPASLSQQAEIDGELTLEARLMAMGLGPSPEVVEPDTPETAAKKANMPLGEAPRAGSLAVVLVQALKTQDKALIEYCLSSSNPEVVHATVRRLPVDFVLAFLTQVIDRVQSQPSRGVALFPWIKAVLNLHTAYLLSMPDLPRHLGALYQLVDGRLAVFKKLSKLSGRLDLVMSQISARTGQDSLDPLIVYTEGGDLALSGDDDGGDDDDEDNGGGDNDDDDDDDLSAGSDDDALDDQIVVGDDDGEDLAGPDTAASESEDDDQDILPVPAPTARTVKPGQKKKKKAVAEEELAEFDDDFDD